MTDKLQTSGWAPALAWIHAAVFLVAAVACYLAPQALFGAAVWLQMPRLATRTFSSPTSSVSRSQEVAAPTLAMHPRSRWSSS